jgi:hypothetical protein
LEQDWEDTVSERWSFIQEEHAMVASDTSPGRGMCMPPINWTSIRDRLMRRVKGQGRDQCREVAGLQGPACRSY